MLRNSKIIILLLFVAVQRFETRALHMLGEYSTTELSPAPGIGVLDSGGSHCASRARLWGFQEDAHFSKAGCFSREDSRLLSHGYI